MHNNRLIRQLADQGVLLNQQTTIFYEVWIESARNYCSYYNTPTSKTLTCRPCGHPEHKYPDISSNCKPEFCPQRR